MKKINDFSINSTDNIVITARISDISDGPDLSGVMLFSNDELKLLLPSLDFLSSNDINSTKVSSPVIIQRVLNALRPLVPKLQLGNAIALEALASNICHI